MQRLHITADSLLQEYFGESVLPVRAYAVARAPPVFAPSQSRTKDGGGAVSDADKAAYRHTRSLRLFSAARQRVAAMSTGGRVQRAREEVFEERLRRPHRPAGLVFNFIGSNQLDGHQLRIRRPDRRYDLRWDGTPSRPFLKYERTTRCIKYCSTRNCSGDLNLFV